MRFSLILATVGRVEEPRAFLASLGEAALVREVIVVDQNEDERLAPVLAAFSHITFVHRRMASGHVSAARNAGIPLARGDIVAFPDDDCTYAPGLLEGVAERLAALPVPGMVTALVASESGMPSAGGYAPPRVGPVTRDNVFVTAREPGLFIAREALARLGGFDQRFGLGTAFTSCESADLALRLVAAGVPAVFDPALVVRHHDSRLSAIGLARVHGSAAGFGACLRHHRYGIGTLGRYLLRALGGMVMGVLRADGACVAFYGRTLRGRLWGYWTWHDEGAL
ncbi:MAG: glycosyltransferase [Rhodospirillales bacterium]|nr:glycosyltransferase [Rhodospirillales bacterium]